MGAAVGSALRPRAGAVIWAAAGRSRATSKRAELADLVGVPDVAALARRSDVIVSVCPPHAAREVGGAGRGGARDPGRHAPPPGLRRRQRRLARDRARASPTCSAPTGSSTGRSSARRRGSAGTRCCGCPGAAAARRRRPVRRVAVRPPGSWAPSWAPPARSRRASRCRARRCRRSGWRSPPPPAPYGVEDELRERAAAQRRRLRGRRGAPRPAGPPRRGGGRGRWTRRPTPWPPLGLPDGFSRAAAEIYRRLADGRLTVPGSPVAVRRADASGSATTQSPAPTGPPRRADGARPAATLTGGGCRPDPAAPCPRSDPPRGRRTDGAADDPDALHAGLPGRAGVVPSAWRCATAPSRTRHVISPERVRADSRPWSFNPDGPKRSTRMRRSRYARLEQHDPWRRRRTRPSRRRRPSPRRAPAARRRRARSRPTARAGRPAGPRACRRRSSRVRAARRRSRGRPGVRTDTSRRTRSGPAGPAGQPQHRHQRHDPRPARRRAAPGRSPSQAKKPPIGPADLELVARLDDLVQVARDLAVVEPARRSARSPSTRPAPRAASDSEYARDAV